MAEVWQFLQGHPKPAFSEKVQREDQEKFFKNHQKTALLDKILVPTAALQVPEWPSYGNSRKVTQNSHFLKKCKGRTKGNFSKIALKVAFI